MLIAIVALTQYVLKNKLMKHLVLTLVSVISMSIYGQDITGKWNGALKVQGVQLRLVFNVTASEGGYSATMDSPDQGATGIPVTETTFTDPNIKFVIANAGIEYSGVLKENQFVGTFKQSGMEFPMNLSRDAIAKEVSKRPQEPKKPFPYYTEDISFENTAANITLSGTLSLPSVDGNFPVVILISGSGPQNRDEELFGHKPFLVISDFLTKNGIAVLRYDDRGVGQSKGVFETATTVDFASDLESAIAYLKTRNEIDKNKIGLVGHSEGALIASIVASKTKDVNFLVMMAGTGVPGDQLLLLQQQAISRARGSSETDINATLERNAEFFELIINSDNDETLKRDVTNLFKATLEKDTTQVIPNGMTKEKYIAMQVDQITSPWMQYFIRFDPTPVLEEVSCPVLVVNGEKDLQVPAVENVPAIKKALYNGGNTAVTTIVFPDLNHLFQESDTGLPSEYGSIEQTFAPNALLAITDWILTQTK